MGTATAAPNTMLLPLLNNAARRRFALLRNSSIEHRHHRRRSAIASSAVRRRNLSYLVGDASPLGSGGASSSSSSYERRTKKTTTTTMPSSFSSSSLASFSSSASPPSPPPPTDTTNTHQAKDPQHRLARTLYRRLLRWCSDAGTDVPFDSVPPVTLTPPLVDGAALECLARMRKPSESEAKGNDDEEARLADAERESYLRPLSNLLPETSIVTPQSIVAPMQNASDVRGVIQVSYRLNNVPPSCRQRPATQTAAATAIDDDNNEEVAKERIALVLETIKSLNELNRSLDRRKTRRQRNRNRTNVQYRIGDVVQHRFERWRGVIVGWSRGDEDENGGGDGTTKKTTQKEQRTSLTTKDYSRVPDETTPSFASSTEHTEVDASGNDEEDEVRCTVILDSGDAYMYGGRPALSSNNNEAMMTGMPEVVQSDLVEVSDARLRRIRSHWVSTKFDRYDPATNRFVPNRVLRYEYPADYECHDDDEPIGKEAAAAAGADRPDSSSGSGIDATCHEIVDGVRTMAEQLRRSILDILVSRSQTVFRSEALGGDDGMYIVANLERRLKSLSAGDVDNAQDRLTSSSSSSPTTAAQHLRALLSLTLEVFELLWQRRIAERHKDKIQFPLGTIVKHTKYDFRGVVVAWDPTPSVDVSRWDGLRDVPDAHERPFYHVIPDQRDCVRAFGGERPFRYVCDANLEVCPVDERAIEVDLDPEWELDAGNSGGFKYEPPNELKFKFAEDLGEHEDLIVQCLEKVKQEITALHKEAQAIEPSGESMSDTIGAKLSVNNLFFLLQVVGNLDDAVTVEDVIKEIWKANEDETLRWRLDSGIAHLQNGNKEAAIEAFSSIVVDDPTYVEAWNKKATAHYMLGEMQEALDAAQHALALEPRHFPALNGLGLVQHDMKRYGSAITSFRRSILLDPWSPASSRLAACVDLLQTAEAAAEENAVEEGAEEGSAPYEK